MNCNVLQTYGATISFGNYSNDVLISSSTATGSSSYAFQTINFALITNFNQVIRLQKQLDINYMKITINGTLATNVNANFNIELQSK